MMKKKGFRGCFFIKCKDTLEIKLPPFESDNIDFPIHEKHWVSNLAVIGRETFLKVVSATANIVFCFLAEAFVTNKNKEAFICISHKIKRKH